jgi:hypothetical protein
MKFQSAWYEVFSPGSHVRIKTDEKTQIPSRNYQWSWPGVGFLSFSNPIYMYVGRDAVYSFWKDRPTR